MHAINQPEVMISHAAQKFDDAGNLKDDVAKDLIRKLLANLCTLARSRQSAS
jgi:chromate reductase